MFIRDENDEGAARVGLIASFGFGVLNCTFFGEVPRQDYALAYTVPWMIVFYVFVALIVAACFLILSRGGNLLVRLITVPILFVAIAANGYWNEQYNLQDTEFMVSFLLAFIGTPLLVFGTAYPLRKLTAGKKQDTELSN